MRKDEITRVAQGDQLICALGDVWLSKSMDNRLIRYRTSSFRMRLAARLLLETRNLLYIPDLDMFELIMPKNFDAIAKATLLLCKSNDCDELKHPSVALKVGYDMSRLAGLKLAQSFKIYDDIGKIDAQEFLQVMKLQWATNVSKLAHTVVNERHFKERRQLPNPKDTQTLAEKLTSSSNDIDLSDKGQYTAVAKLVLPRLMLYNRRRCGEIEALP